MKLSLNPPAGCVLVLACCLTAGCWKKPVVDEAKAAGKTTADFPKITADVFAPLDQGGIDGDGKLTDEEIRGRNTWILWTGGNQHFWNEVSQDSFGLMDLLKVLDNRHVPRGERFAKLGLINQPGFRAATKPDKYGLWLDEPTGPEPAGIDEAVYGKPTGVMGFRLFPNPEFENSEAAKQAWSGEKFVSDPEYWNRKDVVRPYRIGVSCGSCHVSMNPVHPPADPANPAWENLASAIGNQYIREGAVFACNVVKGGFFYEMIAAQPPGTSDTSRIATDHINNPNSINSIFLLAERLRIAEKETLASGALNIPGTQKEMPVPHILKDGADSVGVPGATIRVYVNIGLFSEYWLTRHNRLIGLTPQKPFEIAYAQEHSVFWRATEERVGDIAAFFSRLKSFRLADAPGGAAHLTSDPAVLTRGKIVFAENCASCHSSKTPEGLDPQSPAGVEALRAAVLEPDFLENNFLSDDRRKPVALIKTNTSRAFGTNAKAGHVWDNFSSQTYKELPIGEPMEFYNPFDEASPIRFDPAARNVGPGFFRTPSLVSIWTSAPYLNNNALGKFTGDPSVAGRIEAFSDAIQKLLWPEKRAGKASIWRTQNECALQLRKEYLPGPLQKLADADGFLRIGPIPKGMPINLLGSVEPDLVQAAEIKVALLPALLKIHKENLTGDAATAELRKAVPALLKASKAPDFIEDEGHEFGAQLPDADKLALIEFLKTM